MMKKVETSRIAMRGDKGRNSTCDVVEEEKKEKKKKLKEVIFKQKGALHEFEQNLLMQKSDCL